jgi:hypothetical protein
MAWTFNGTGSQTTLPSGSYLDIPDGDWAFTGWFRLPTNNGTNIRRLLAWGTPAATPHLQVFVVEDNAGFSNDDRLCARYVDAAGNNTTVMWPFFVLSNHLNKWIGWTFTHNGSNNTTYLRVYDPANGATYTDTSAQAVGTCDNTDITEPLYLGASNAGTDATRFKGDLAETTFIPGLFLDFNITWPSFIHGVRGYCCTRGTGNGWNVPMLGDRTEVWGTGNTIITPSSTNVATATYDNPQLRLITKRAPILLEGVAELPTQNVSSTLNFVQDASVPLIPETFFPTPNSTLNFVQTAEGVRDVPASANSTLTLSDVAGQTKEFSGNSALALGSVVLHLHIANDRLPCDSVLNLAQYAQVAGHRNPTHDLGLVQTVDIVFPIKPVIVQPLGITQHTSTPHRAFVTQNLGFTQHTSTPLPTQHVTSTLNFVQESPIGNVDNTLNFVQSVAFSKSLTARSTMNLVSTMTRIMIYNRTLTHANVVGHALTWYEDSPCGRKQYTPFQGENTIPLDVSPPKDTLGDPQGEDNTFKLYQPYLGVHTSEIEIRQPELDNRDRNAFSRVSQETRGGKLLVFADPIWPKVRTLAVTVVGLTETKVNEFQAFILATVGQEIGLTDWEGRLWKGIITNPNDNATQDGRARWTITFEFEGEMLDVQQPGEEGDGDGMALNLSHSVTAVIV